jgi:hypothetical protein
VVVVVVVLQPGPVKLPHQPVQGGHQQDCQERHLLLCQLLV